MALTVVQPHDRALEPAGNRNGNVLKQVISFDDPYAHIGQLTAGYFLETHSHSENEIMIVLEGVAEVGEARCGPGTVVLIDAGEQYSLRAGGDGPLTFIVMRGRRATLQRPGEQ